MEYPKFIITNRGYLRLGMVHLHKDLLQGNEQCYGGGFYEFDYITNRLLLHGRSYDYGVPRWDWISVLRVPLAYKNFKIVYQTKNIDTKDLILNDYLCIEYV